MLLPEVPSSSSLRKGLYNPKAFVTHAALLGQACAHCPKFLTAASRRSLGRVSVPVWLIILSDQLTIVGLVSRYLTNNLIVRRPLPKRITALLRREYAVLDPVSRAYPSLWGTFLRVTQPSAARVFYTHHSTALPSLESISANSISPLLKKLVWSNSGCRTLPLDLHVLGTPPAFILSQDQTLQKRICSLYSV